MRLFIALPVLEPIRSQLGEFQVRLAETRARVRWVEPAGYHLTVKFLGAVDEGLLPEIRARLTRAAEQVPVFPLEIDGVGHLPERGPARVIVAHAHSPDQRLTRLHRLVDSAIGGMGLPLDTRELSPHITLGRVKANTGLNRLLRLLAKHEADYLGSFDVKEVVLYRSTPGAGGSVYEPLHTARLADPVGGAPGLINAKCGMRNAR